MVEVVVSEPYPQFQKPLPEGFFEAMPELLLERARNLNFSLFGGMTVPSADDVLVGFVRLYARRLGKRSAKAFFLKTEEIPRFLFGSPTSLHQRVLIRRRLDALHARGLVEISPGSWCGGQYSWRPTRDGLEWALTDSALSRAAATAAAFERLSAREVLQTGERLVDALTRPDLEVRVLMHLRIPSGWYPLARFDARTLTVTVATPAGKKRLSMRFLVGLRSRSDDATK